MRIIIGLLAILWVAPAKAEIVLYCQDELATGFIKDKNTKQWEEGSFVKERYTIKFSKDYKTLSGLHIPQSSTPIPMKCHQPYNHLPDQIICNEYSGFSFRYHTKKMRFVFVQAGIFGFVKNLTDTDSIRAGTCKKF